MKKLLIIMLVLGVAIVIMPMSGSAQSTNIWITVSVVVPASVTIITTNTNWFILNKPLNFVTNRDEACVVSNSSGGAEQFNITVNDLAAWSASTTTNNGPDTYVLQGIFRQYGSTQPPTGNYSAFNGSDDVLLTGLNSATITNIADSTNIATNAYNVPSGEKRDLWLKFKFPSSTSFTTQTTVTRLIISATVK